MAEPSQEEGLALIAPASLNHIAHGIQELASAAAPSRRPCITVLHRISCACMQARISLGLQTAWARKRGIATDTMTVQEILQCTQQARAEAKERRTLIRRQKVDASRQVCKCWPKEHHTAAW